MLYGAVRRSRHIHRYKDLPNTTVLNCEDKNFKTDPFFWRKRGGASVGVGIFGLPLAVQAKHLQESSGKEMLASVCFLLDFF